MIAVRVGNKCEPLRIPWIQPQIVFGQVNAALVPNIDHWKIYRNDCADATYIDRLDGSRFDESMRFAAIPILALVCSVAHARTAEEPRVISHVTPLPVALDPAFQFRKTKIYFLSEKGPAVKQKGGKSGGGSGTGTGGQTSSGAATAHSKSTSAVQDASLNFERQYRLFGAVTKLDQHQRFGDYFDFYWRAKRSANLTVRLEYRQEKLHAHVQAQEISYANVRGTLKTEFKIIGDDYFDYGRVTAWRCLLIEDGKIVAENRSFMWR